MKVWGSRDFILSAVGRASGITRRRSYALQEDNRRRQDCPNKSVSCARRDLEVKGHFPVHKAPATAGILLARCESPWKGLVSRENSLHKGGSVN